MFSLMSDVVVQCYRRAKEWLQTESQSAAETCIGRLSWANATSKRRNAKILGHFWLSCLSLCTESPKEENKTGVMSDVYGISHITTKDAL